MPFESRKYLFVYGSLKRGYRLHEFLAGEQFVGDFQTQPDYRLFDCGSYPGLIATERGAGQRVHGEVYRVGSATWRVLDEIECVSECLYECREISLSDCKLNSVVHAYFYLPSTESMRELGNCWPA